MKQNGKLLEPNLKIHTGNKINGKQTLAPTFFEDNQRKNLTIRTI